MIYEQSIVLALYVPKPTNLLICLWSEEVVILELLYFRFNEIKGGICGNVSCRRRSKPKAYTADSQRERTLAQGLRASACRLMSFEPPNHLLECGLLSSLYLRIRVLSNNGKAVWYTGVNFDFVVDLLFFQESLASR